MKYLLIALLIFAPLAVMAEETGKTDWHGANEYFNNHYEKYLKHTHEYSQYEPELENGLGLDLIVFESDSQSLAPDAITLEGRYDFAADNGSIYAVASYNLWDRFFKK